MYCRPISPLNRDPQDADEEFLLLGIPKVWNILHHEDSFLYQYKAVGTVSENEGSSQSEADA